MDLEYSVLVGGLARAVGIVFAYATIAKLGNLSAVSDALMSYGLLPASMIPSAVFLLILGEAGVAVSHLGLVALPLASPITATLLTLFLGFSIYSVLRGDHKPCLCFGAKKKDIVDGLTIARISALLAAEIIVLIAVFQANQLAPLSTDVATTATTLALALIVISLVSWVFTAPELLAWWRLRPSEMNLRSAVTGLPAWATDPLILEMESAGVERGGRD